jgi:diguanylate cyclase (GGDEF)-like protein
MLDDKTATHLHMTTAVLGPEFGPAQGSDRPMYLITVSGKIPGALHSLNPAGTCLGRSQDNGVQFTDPGISRQHATIVADGQGEPWVTDLDSTNGTFLNGERLAPHCPRRLRDGDRLRFGTSAVVKFVRLDPSDEQFQRELYERTVRDPLTGLYHRAYFVDQLEPLADLSRARGLGLGVLMLDVDHFKRVNDSFGHDAGDVVLREVAAVLRESTRGEDLVARYGGEEFVAALPVAAPDQASERAERIRDRLAGRRVAGPGLPPGGLSVTASLGLAFARPGRLLRASALITAADRCLYQAKDSGRDRVVLRIDPPSVVAPSLATPRTDGA